MTEAMADPVVQQHPTSPKDVCLGSGTFASVMAERRDGVWVAVKRYYKSDDALRAIGEFRTLQSLRHPNIVRMVSAKLEGPEMELVLEYCGDATVLEWIKEKRSFPSRNSIYSAVVSALVYLHEEANVAHMDVKADNLVLSEHGEVRLVDFNFSRRYRAGQSEYSLSGMLGSPAYAAPEVMQQTLYSGYKADVWSFGILVFVMAFEHFPFVAAAASQDPLFRRFRDAQTRGCSPFQAILSSTRFTDHTTPSERAMLDQCLHMRPTKRPHMTVLRDAQLTV